MHVESDDKWTNVPIATIGADRLRLRIRGHGQVTSFLLQSSANQKDDTFWQKCKESKQKATLVTKWDKGGA
jgi:hypothetical protein